MRSINYWLNLIEYYKQFLTDERGNAAQGSVLLSLALFIILLAFFIVMNAVSHYSEEKVDGAFASLDYAFSQNILYEEDQLQSDAEDNSNEKGEGDSIEDIQGTLRSVLPGLDMRLASDPNGGQVMAIRMKKDMFDRLSTRLVPVFVRILNVKDGAGKFSLTLTSYVRDPLAKSAELSFRVLQTYKDNFYKFNAEKKRLSFAIEKGNPAFLQFRFDRRS